MVVSAGEEASSWADMKESNEPGKSECFGRVDRTAQTPMSRQRCKLTNVESRRGLSQSAKPGRGLGGGFLTAAMTCLLYVFEETFTHVFTTVH